MAFCRNCGSKIEGNEKFCGNCGAPVDDNVPISQNASNMGGYNQAVPSVNFDNFSVYMSEIFNLAVNMISKPISTTLNISKTLKKQSVFLLLVISSIVYSLLNIWGIKASVSRASSSLNDIPIVGSLGSGLTNSIPYGKIFFIILIFFIISILTIFSVNHLIGKYIFKSSCDAINTFSVAVCSSIPIIYGTFLLIILSFISSILGVIGFFIGVIISILCIFRGMTSELGLSEDKISFMIPISYLGMFLVDFIVLLTVMKNMLDSTFL